jgi:phosphatidylserine/phosphatidylglycerophosphate/cardiolipin synthase-like enzyme
VTRGRIEAPRPPTRQVALRLIRDGAHYSEVISRGIADARVSVWIATANLKELHVEAPMGTRARAAGRMMSVLELFRSLAARGVEVRVLHGGLPSGPFRATLARFGGARASGIALRRCPRVHLKMVAVDGALLYMGSANFTGAGLGVRSDGRRNFEAGIVTDDELLLDEMQAGFQAIWSGRECKGCKLRRECPAPLDVPAPPPAPARVARRKGNGAAKLGGCS